MGWERGLDSAKDLGTARGWGMQSKSLKGMESNSVKGMQSHPLEL